MILHFIGSLSLQCQMHIESFMVNESTQKVLILTWLGPFFFFFRTMTGSYCAILVMTICVIFWSAKSLLIYDTDHIGLIVARWFSWMRILWMYSEFWCFPSIYSLELHGYEKKNIQVRIKVDKLAIFSSFSVKPINAINHLTMGRSCFKRVQKGIIMICMKSKYYVW